MDYIEFLKINMLRSVNGRRPVVILTEMPVPTVQEIRAHFHSEIKAESEILSGKLWFIVGDKWSLVVEDECIHEIATWRCEECSAK